MSVVPTFVTQCNGQAATAEALSALAFAGFAHFTAVQIRHGKLRGLDLHLQRLRKASHTLFAQALPDEQIRHYLRSALALGPADLSLMLTTYAPAGEFTTQGREQAPAVLIRTSPAASGPQGPLKLAVFEHQRFLPEVKHVGELAKTHLLHQAAMQGFDDVVFVDGQGCLSEATIWNLAFWDGQTVIWPQAEILAGTTMGIVRRQLTQLGIPQREQNIRLRDLPQLAGAVVMNSWTPGIAVLQIGEHRLPEAPDFLNLLHQAFQAEPWVSP